MVHSIIHAYTFLKHWPLPISLYDFVHLLATAKISYLVLALRVLFFDEWNANVLPFLEISCNNDIKSALLIVLDLDVRTCI